MQQVPLLASTLNKPSLSRSLQPARPAQIRTALRSVASVPAAVQPPPLPPSTQLVTDLNNNHPQLLLLQSDHSLISTNGAINLNALQHDHLLLSSVTDQPLLPSLSSLTETMATSDRQSLPSIAELKQWKLNRTNNTQTQSAVGSVACNNSTSTSLHTGVPSAVVVQPSAPVIQITPSDTTALSSSIEADSLLLPSETFLLNGEQLLFASPIIVSGIHSNNANNTINGNNRIISTNAVGHSRQAKSMDSSTTTSVITMASAPTSSMVLPAFSSLQPPCISYNEFPTELNPKFVDDEEFMFLDELDDAVGLDLYDPDCESYLTNPMIKMEDAFQVDRFHLKSSPTLAELNLGESDDLFDHLGLQPPKRNGLRNWRASGMDEEQQELLLNSSLYGPAHVNGHVVGSGGSLNTSALMMLNGSALSNTNGNTSKTTVPLANSNRVLCNLLNSRPAVSINGAASDAMMLGLRSQSDASTTPVNGDNVNTQLRLPNRNRPTSSRNRNSSMSTEYSFSSSHDEGFASQAEEDELDEKLDEETDRCSQETDRTSEVDSTGRTPEPTEEDQNRLASSSGKTSKLRPTVEPTTKPKRLKVNSVSSNVGSNVAPVQSSSCSTLGGRQRLSSKCSMRSMGEQSEEEGKLDGEDSSDDEDDESFYGDYEAKDLLGACTSDDLNNRWSLNMGRTRKNCAQRYFWQYNVQSKGPKGVKLTASLDNDWSYDQETTSLAVGTSSLDTAATATPVGTTADPVVVLDLEPLDPVFSPNCQIEGVKHAGKARRGDGNDLTPNPRKLLMIGLELKKLSKIINDLVPVAEVPAGNKPNSRKEKNKLASRACRLKKKAQHEANKIKLHGLSAEQRKLLATLSEARRLISYSSSTSSLSGSSSNANGPLRMDKDALQKLRAQGGVCNWLRRLQQLHGQSLSVAGNSTDFVNSVLDEVSAGNCNGGLDKL